MIDRYCNCEDWPCCGHGSGSAGGGLDPEDAEAWLDDLDPDERAFADEHMAPCPLCGEMRPKHDDTMVKEGCCYMCTQDDQRPNSPIAKKNIRHFNDQIIGRDQRIQDLERQNADLQRLLEER